jgi:hypothetical protein
MSEDRVRVLRLIEYIGPRSLVEHVLNTSFHGTKKFGSLMINVATIGTFPEILDTALEVEEREKKARAIARGENVNVVQE